MKHKRLNIFLLAIVLSIATITDLYSQENCIKTTFWRIITPDQKDTSYILGTNHICMDSYLIKYNYILDKFNESEVFVGETIFPENINDMYKLIVDTIHWSKIASRLQKKNIHSLFKKYFKYTNSQMNNFTISFLTNDIDYIAGYILSEQVSELKGRYYLDDYFRAQSRMARRPMESLEPVKTHVQLIAYKFEEKLDKPKSKQRLKMQIKALDSLVCMFNTNRNALLDKYTNIVFDYYNNNIDYYFSYSTQGLEAHAIITQRNESWLPKLTNLLNSKKTFIAVGLNHLRFKYGLIELLKGKGYIVEPIILEL